MDRATTVARYPSMAAHIAVDTNPPDGKPSAIRCRACLGTGRNKRGGPCQQCAARGVVIGGRGKLAARQTADVLLATRSAILSLVGGALALLIIVILILAVLKS